ncbi:MAG TPA: crosslink repair DNA glycosylase YcaQ family protein [Bacillota bacterium]|jgi:hypothetical protein
MRPLAVTAIAARRALLAQHGLLNAPDAGITPWRRELKGRAGTIEALGRLRCVQVDPVSAVERNHHLVMYNRVGSYRPSQLDNLFPAGLAFEYLANARCILPLELFPGFWPLMRMIARNGRKERRRLWASLLEVAGRVRDHGPVQPRHVGNQGPRLMGMGYHTPDESSKASGRAIDLLWVAGDLVISRRRGLEKSYDFPERVLPPELLAALDPAPHRDEHGLLDCWPEAGGRRRKGGVGAEGPSRPWSAPHAGAEGRAHGAADWLLDLYIQAYQVFEAGDFRLGWQKHGADRRRELLAERVKDGRLVELAIEGVKRPYYATPEAADLAARADAWEVEPEVRFIPPLDNLLWRRRRVADLFAFDYTWEVYRKPEVRRYGYYTMPILYGDRLVGRLDPKLDREHGRLVVQMMQFEPGTRLGKRDRARIEAELDRFARFHGAKSWTLAGRISAGASGRRSGEVP